LDDESVNEKRNTFCVEGDRRTGAREKRGRNVYGRGEYRGPEAGDRGGEIMQNCAIFRDKK